MSQNQKKAKAFMEARKKASEKFRRFYMDLITDLGVEIKPIYVEQTLNYGEIMKLANFEFFPVSDELVETVKKQKLEDSGLAIKD